METPVRQFRRIVAVLEDLVSQEELLLRAEDYLAVPPLQLRMAPLVEFLLASVSLADDTMRRRISTLIDRRSQSEQTLNSQLSRVRDELNQIKNSRQRIARVTPAYRQAEGSAASSQLCARG